MTRSFLKILIIILISSFLTVLFFLNQTLYGLQQTEKEPNDDLEQAQPVQLNQIIQGFFQKEEDKDWYQLDFSKKGKYIIRITLSGVSGFDSKLSWCDSSGNEILRSNLGDEGQGEILTNIGVVSSTYFIKVEGWGQGSSQTPYTLEVKLLGPWDSSQEFEPNNDIEEANSIKLGQTIKGYIQPDDDDDWYSFSVPEPGKDILIIRTSGVNDINQSLTLLNEDEEALKEIDIEEEGKGEIIVRMRVHPGKYYLKVYSWGINPDTPYELHLGEKPRPPATPEEVKKALEKALDYLAAEQTENGCWNGKYERNAGVAGLCLMALVGGECAGKDYTSNIERVVRFLKSKYHPSSDYETAEKKDYWGGLIGDSDLMYEHGIATMALIEAMVALNKWDLEPIVNEAVQLLLRTQNTEHKPKTLEGLIDPSSPNYGGWRYDPNSTDSDISVSGWQILALKAAQMASFKIPEWSINASIKFLHNCYNDEEKFFTYEPDGGSGGCVRAGVGALCLKLLGHSSDPRIKSAIRYMFNNPPTWIYEDPGEGYPFYYWYYGTRVMLDEGGADWKLWKSWMCRLLVDHQSDDGSWVSQQNEEKMPYYTTALGALMLELCCGHVPIYMRKEMPVWGYIQVRQEGKAASKMFKNIELVLDASNSMWGQISGGSKISVAKKTLQQIISGLPEDISVGLRVYGHRFPIQDNRACRDSEQLISISPLDKDSLIETINNIKPKGKTPLVFSVLQAIKDFTGKKGGNIILITDGIESCGGDIRSIAPALKKSNIELNLNIVGFDIKEAKARRELESIAKEAGGIYDARNTKELITSLQQTLQIPFEILNTQKEVVARGLAGGEAIRLRQGNYWLRFKIGSQTIEERVQITGSKTVAFWLKKEGNRWVLKKNLID